MGFKPSAPFHTKAGRPFPRPPSDQLYSGNWNGIFCIISCYLFFLSPCHSIGDEAAMQSMAYFPEQVPGHLLAHPGLQEEDGQAGLGK